jgi:hypothetical protein
MKLSEIFHTNCISWYTDHVNYNHVGRQRVYGYLVSHYGSNLVLRHMRQIKAALDKIEHEER